MINKRNKILLLGILTGIFFSLILDNLSLNIFAEEYIIMIKEYEDYSKVIYLYEDDRKGIKKILGNFDNDKWIDISEEKLNKLAMGLND